ncbi:MAG: XdhC family protein [Acidobacteriota bacterium]
MYKDLELWQFIADRLKQDQAVMLLVVAESSGSSPGRQGYKMAVGADGELFGSIGGGMMEVSLVEQSRSILSEPPALVGGQLQKPARSNGIANTSIIAEQVHRKDSPNASGMICSGKQTVIFRILQPSDEGSALTIIGALETRNADFLSMSPALFGIEARGIEGRVIDFEFERESNTEYVYRERLGFKNDLYIVGGGHCALALSELMSKMDFYIRLFDDRPALNTIAKNHFAHEIRILKHYETVAHLIPSGDLSYVVVMTLGYRSDEIVIRSLLQSDLKYLGVLGSKAKMRTLLKALENEGFPPENLAAIHTPIGLAINSRTPEEIAISIAAEIISVKNA